MQKFKRPEISAGLGKVKFSVTGAIGRKPIVLPNDIYELSIKGAQLIEKGTMLLIKLDLVEIGSESFLDMRPTVVHSTESGMSNLVVKGQAILESLLLFARLQTDEISSETIGKLVGVSFTGRLAETINKSDGSRFNKLVEVLPAEVP